MLAQLPESWVWEKAERLKARTVTHGIIHAAENPLDVSGHMGLVRGGGGGGEAHPAARETLETP